MSIRDLLTSHIHKSSPRAESVQAVNDALTSAPGALRLHFDESNGYTRIPEHPATQAVEYAMALIAEDTATLLSGEPADSLAICDAPLVRSTLPPNPRSTPMVLHPVRRPSTRRTRLLPQTRHLQPGLTPTYNKNAVHRRRDRHYPCHPSSSDTGACRKRSFSALFASVP